MLIYLREKLVRPFYQGSIDTFCAAYAVLNAVQITHGIKAMQARNLFNKLMLTISRDEIVFTRILTLKTNYVAMVDVFLKICAKEYPIKVRKPFENENCSLEGFWSTLEKNLDPDNKKTAIFQFEKRIPSANNPIFAHWTTAWETVDNDLLLHDCSPELNAINRLHKDKLVLEASNQEYGEYIRINAPTLFLIEAV